MTDYTTARRNMVENQLRPSGVDDPRVLSAFEAVPRELFLPRKLRGVAYQDEDIDLGQGRHLIEPLVLGRMLQSAAVQPDEVALVVGCDTGYCAAVLSRLAATVFLLLPEEAVTEEVGGLLDEGGFENVIVQTGSAMVGLPAQAPFNVILLAGSVDEPPSSLRAQLEDRGRLVAVVDHGRAGKLTVVTRIGDGYGRRTPYDARIPPLSQLQLTATFRF